MKINRENTGILVAFQNIIIFIYAHVVISHILQ